jgi:hypothetical protein
LTACKLLLALVCLALGGGGLLFARLALFGPIALNSLAPQIAKALDERFGHGLEFSIDGIAIVKNGYVPALRTGTLSINEGSGRTLLSAPRAEVTVDPLALVAGRVTPKRLEIFDVQVHLALRPDGSLVLPVSPGPPEGAAPMPGIAAASPPASASFLPDAWALAPQPPPAQPLGGGPARSLLVKRLGAAIRLVIDTLTNPASPAAAIDRIGIMRGKLVIDDESANQSFVFSGVNLSFDKLSGATKFTLSVDGPNGRWLASGVASGQPGAERRLLLSVSNLSLDEVLLAAGTRTIGADFDMPLSAKLAIRLTADQMISEAAGELDLGAGYLRFDDPNDEPMMVDGISAGFRWDPARRRIVIDRGQLAAGATHFAALGLVALPVREGDPWSIHLVNAGQSVAGPERPGENPVPIDHIALSARLYLAEKKLALDRFSFSGPQCGFALAGTVDWVNGPHIRLGASISPTPIHAVLRLWPSFIAPPVRSYLLARAAGGMVEKGTLQIDYDAADLQAMRAQHAAPDSKTLLDFTITNGRLNFLPGVPPLEGIDGVGHITGRTAVFTASKAAIDAGNGHVLTLLGGAFHIADTDVKPAVPAVLEAKVSGSVAAIGDLLSHDALKPYARLPLDPETLSGQAEGDLEIGMRLGPEMSPADITLKVNATVVNFAAERMLGNEKLENTTLTVNVDPSGLRASGEGRIFGVPATVSMERMAGQAAEASIGLTLDDEARAREGLGAIPGVSGPVGAKITAAIGTGEKPKARVDLDLTGTSIDIPGISKPAGQPGKAVFTLAVNDASTVLDPLVVEAGTIQARGRMDLAPGFSVITASFPQARVSPGDDMKVEATSAGDSLKVMVRGNTIDARPFLKSLIFSPPGSAGVAGGGEPQNRARPVKEIELDVRAGTLNGYNKKTITGAELHFARLGTQFKQFSFAGTFGRLTVSSNLTGGGASPQLNVVSEDAGSLLSFLDLYKQMERGRLSAGMAMGSGEVSGVLVVNDFVLRDEPGLRRLVMEGAPPIEAPGRPPIIDANAVAFSRLQVRFQRDGSRLVLTDGAMHGSSIGLTADGAIDFVRDNVDIKGTFVPIYAFNNMFARIPVVGLILGGGSEEQGLIGVNYRITGLASAPTLSINPLSAIAPGILRQIFGVVDFDPMHPQR